jgi:hypothetical protein
MMARLSGPVAESLQATTLLVVLSQTRVSS